MKRASLQRAINRSGAYARCCGSSVCGEHLHSLTASRAPTESEFRSPSNDDFVDLDGELFSSFRFQPIPPAERSVVRAGTF